MTNIQKSAQATITIPDEQILVVKRTLLFGDASWQGLRRDNLEQYIELIKEHHEFMPRSIMESDPSYKQIISYLVFTHGGRYFLMQRHAQASEQRLRSKMSFGIGGHIRQEDLHGSIFDWAQREFDEEVHYSGSGSISLIGIINDDTTPVGQVHLGLIMLLKGDSHDIQVKSELQSGELLTLDECKAHYDAMERWSQLIFNELTQAA